MTPQPTFTRAGNQAAIDQLIQPYRDMVQMLIQKRCANVAPADHAIAIYELLQDLKTAMTSEPTPPAVIELAMLKLFEIVHEYQGMLADDV